MGRVTHPSKVDLILFGRRKRSVVTRPCENENENAEVIVIEGTTMIRKDAIMEAEVARKSEIQQDVRIDC